MDALVLRPCVESDFDALVNLRSQAADLDEFDSFSTMESLPSVGDLRLLANDSAYFCVVAADGESVGYGLIRWWDEASGPRLVLCDWYLAPPFRESSSAVLNHLEEVAIALPFDDETRRRSMLGTNASSAQPYRVEVIKAAGYEHTFTQVEMELRAETNRNPSFLSGVRFRDAQVSDASALIQLTEGVWEGREFFTLPTVERFSYWLERSDRSLFNLAVVDEEIVGFVASIVRGAMAEIEDVQVHPRVQRQGIATALLINNLNLLGERGVQIVRLNTEAEDPAGARSLYEKLGFTVVRSYMRYRKRISTL